MGKSSVKVGVTLLVVSVVSLALAVFFNQQPATWPLGDVLNYIWVVRFLLVLWVVTYVWFWIWAVIAIGNIAQAKGYSKTGFVIFAVLLPAVALIVALVLQPSQTKVAAIAAAHMVKCPACAELIQPEAKKCKHCGEVLAQQ